MSEILADILASVPARVARGVALLDEDRPDWYRSVDAGLIDINSTRLCVLGQVYGDYWQAETRFFGNQDVRVTYRESVEYGFNWTVGYGDKEVNALNAEWARVVFEREREDNAGLDSEHDAL